MNRMKATLVAAALVAGTGTGLVVAAGDAAATGTATPWVTPATGASTDGNAVGGLAFFNSAGTQVTGGSSNSAPFAAYIAGLVSPRSGDTKTTVSLYTPEVGKNPGAWSQTDTIGSSTDFPNTTAPEPVKSTALPTYTGDPGDTKLDDFASVYPQTATTAGYVNVYEVRLYTTKPGSGRSVKYDFADIKIDPTTHTWTLVYTPDAPGGTATTSTLSASKTTVNQGETTHLSDIVAGPVDGKAAVQGTVQFKDGSTNVGTPITVSGGKAEADVVVATAGAHSYSAVFTPAALSGFAASTSNAVAVTANKVVTDTSVALAASPTTAAAYTPVTLTATVNPTIPGVVKFFDASMQIGQATVAGSTASITYNSFVQGAHSLTASFTPTNTTDYNASVSPAVTFTATAAAGPIPDDQTIVTDVAPGSLAITTPYTAANPLVLPAMRLTADGKLLKTSAPFGDGTIATYGANGPDGTGSIQVVDTRSGNANWSASAQSRGLTGDTGDSINGQNVGLVDLKAVTVPNNALQSLAVTNTTSANPPVAPNATGTLGLGGQPHEFARTTAGGNGSIGITGTLTLTAPTSTRAGHYTGIVTFTVMGLTTGV